MACAFLTQNVFCLLQLEKDFRLTNTDVISLVQLLY